MHQPPGSTKFPSVQKLFYEQGKLKTFRKNALLFMKGEWPSHVYLIERGLIKASQFTEEGQNITFFLRNKGDAFGLAEVVLQRSHFCHTQCLNECQIRILEADILYNAIRQDSQVSQEVMYIMTDRLIHLQVTVELLVSKPVEWRLAWFLQQLRASTGYESEWLDMQLTHEEIANVIACSRQTVSELLNKWKKQGVVEYERKRIKDVNLEQILVSK